MTNAWMIIYLIEEKDKSGKATRVHKVYHSNKIYVPGSLKPQLNLDALKYSSLSFWKHDKIKYNLIPRSGYSRYRNLVKGFYPSINTIPGYIRPGFNSHLAIHSGMWSAGCIVAVYGHFDLVAHLQNPFFSLWDTADEIIYTKIPGNRFRGRKKIWGKLMIIKDPSPAVL